MKIAILDDYQHVAKRFVDWSEIERRAELTVLTDHLTGEKALAERLRILRLIKLFLKLGDIYKCQKSLS